MKKNVFMKAVSLLLLCTLALSLFTGCKNSANTNANTGTSQESKSTELTTAKEPPVTIQVFIRDPYGVSFDTVVTKTIEEMTNTKLEITAGPAADASNKLSVIMASRKIPDVFNGAENTNFMTYVANGILLPLNKYFDRMPELYNSRPKGTWDAMVEDDGNIYAIPIGVTSGEYINMYRKDWLDKLGLGIPTTIEEYAVVADAVSNKDPDGNNVKDTYAFGSHLGINMRQFAHIFGPFGVQYDQWIDVNGSIAYSNVQPQMKEALKFANRMYSIGALDPEFITDSQSRVKDKVVKGLYGAQCYKIYIFDTNNMSNYYEPFKQNVPNGQWVEGPQLIGPNGNAGKFSLLPGRGWSKTCISKDTKVLDACLRFVNYMASKEGQMLTNYGIEGTHYTMDNDVVKSMVDDVGSKNAGLLLWSEFITDSLYKHTSSEFQRVSALVYEMSETNRPIDPIEGKPEAVQKYKNALEEWTKAQIAKMVVGEIVIDGGFENYVEEWNKRGGKEMTDGYNALYKARKK